MASLFDRLQASISSSASTLSNVSTSSTLEEVTSSDGKVTVKFGMAASGELSSDSLRELPENATVQDVIEAAARATNSTEALKGDYIVLLDGEQVDLDSPFQVGATYRVSFNAGTAGV